MIGLIGRKVGMTRIFTEEGVSTPVTVIEVETNRISQIKTFKNDGYIAIQVTTGDKKRSRISKPRAGHFAKSGIEAGRALWEFRLKDQKLFKLGDELNLKLLRKYKKVDITGKSKGKGFQGVVKRWNFRTQDMSHGNSLSHRAPGSIGQCQTPGRVFKGKKMAGHTGCIRVTTQNLDIVRIDIKRNLLLIKGAVPGSIGADVIVKPAIKQNYDV
ncbi:50S ribosomal protein L3 [Candidatus Photodesmus katoptron]|uniref:50S ribosomal protein L3 n=1 Tax=Candidatus Photodesmus anomalopis TaxID=28176 RepID=UPI0004D39381|nr:50S ribosomal protein L3 [Candidatus Photodesmus katoptron]KEY90132.1 50S ribosomal protein L3 [Candidatus Photodesmus katoptron]